MGEENDNFEIFEKINLFLYDSEGQIFGYFFLLLKNDALKNYPIVQWTEHNKYYSILSETTIYFRESSLLTLTYHINV